MIIGNIRDLIGSLSTEEDAYAAFGRGSSSRALSLMDAYLTSWAQLPGVIVLRNEYESCQMDLLTQTQFWTFAGDHPVTQQIREKGYADFEIGLGEIYDGRFECKLDGVRIALSGATSSEPMINCSLTHRGNLLNPSTGRNTGALRVSFARLPCSGGEVGSTDRRCSSYRAGSLLGQKPGSEVAACSGAERDGKRRSDWSDRHRDRIQL